MDSPIALYYYPERNPSGEHFPGVPLRHLTRAEWRALPRYLRASVARSPFYSRIKPQGEQAPPTAPQAEE